MTPPLFVPFEGGPFFDLCTICGKKLSTRYAQARVSHGRKHVRAGEATERIEGHWLSGKTVFDAAPTQEVEK